MQQLSVERKNHAGGSSTAPAEDEASGPAEAFSRAARRDLALIAISLRRKRARRVSVRSR
jgi:hypothetical protein